MFRKRKSLIILAIALLILGAAIGYRVWKRGELKRNGVLLTGRIVSHQTGTKSQWWFNYEFRYEGKVYNKDKSVDVLRLRTFIGKSFPVIFSFQSEQSEMLITPKDFEIYDLPYPDSLNWVKEYVNKNSYRF
jgi:hypothetical protein